MATIKSFTDLPQSKILSKILPLESADMHWYLAIKGNPKAMLNEGYNEYGDLELPCWSLAALLEVLPKTINFGYENYSTFVLKPLENGKYLADYYDVALVKNNPVDACYEMIIKLHERKMLCYEKN